jgi:hypothetical protein
MHAQYTMQASSEHDDANLGLSERATPNLASCEDMHQVRRMDVAPLPSKAMKGGHMRSASHTTLIVAAGFVAGLAAGAAASADLNEVTVTYDRDVAARTNMGRSVAEDSKLGVTFDQDVAKRTNMQREATDVGTVTVKPDMDIRTRTNMGGIARSQPQQPNAPATAAVER